MHLTFKLVILAILLAYGGGTAVSAVPVPDRNVVDIVRRADSDPNKPNIRNFHTMHYPLEGANPNKVSIEHMQPQKDKSEGSVSAPGPSETGHGKRKRTNIPGEAPKPKRQKKTPEEQEEQGPAGHPANLPTFEQLSKILAIHIKNHQRTTNSPVPRPTSEQLSKILAEHALHQQSQHPVTPAPPQNPPVHGPDHNVQPQVPKYAYFRRVRAPSNVETHALIKTEVKPEGGAPPGHGTSHHAS